MTTIAVSFAVPGTEDKMKVLVRSSPLMMVTSRASATGIWCSVSVNLKDFPQRSSYSEGGSMMSHRSGFSKRTGLYWFSSYLANIHQTLELSAFQIHAISFDEPVSHFCSDSDSAYSILFLLYSQKCSISLMFAAHYVHKMYTYKLHIDDCKFVMDDQL